MCFKHSVYGSEGIYEEGRLIRSSQGFFKFFSLVQAISIFYISGNNMEETIPSNDEFIYKMKPF